MRNLARVSITAALTGVLAAFGLFWLGIALHRALLPEVGVAGAWAITGAVYLLLALAAAAVASRSRAASAASSEKEAEVSPLSMGAGQLGLELGRELEREVRHHPLRAVSLAMLGGAVLGVSPELRRGLVGLFRLSGAGRDGNHDETRRGAP